MNYILITCGKQTLLFLFKTFRQSHEYIMKNSKVWIYIFHTLDVIVLQVFCYSDGDHCYSEFQKINVDDMFLSQYFRLHKHPVLQ